MKVWFRILLAALGLAVSFVAYNALRRNDLRFGYRDLVLLNHSKSNLEIEIDGKHVGTADAESFTRWPTAINGSVQEVELSTPKGEKTRVQLGEGVPVDRDAVVIAVPMVKLTD